MHRLKSIRIATETPKRRQARRGASPVGWLPATLPGNGSALLSSNHTIVSTSKDLPKLLTRVGHGDIADLIGVQPHLPLAASQHGRRQAFLQLQRHHFCKRPSILPGLPPERGRVLRASPACGGVCASNRLGPGSNQQNLSSGL